MNPKNISEEEFQDNLRADIKVLQEMATKYKVVFPSFALILFTIAYMMVKAKTEMLKVLVTLCESFAEEVKEDIDKQHETSINNFLDTLDINPSEFKSEGE